MPRYAVILDTSWACNSYDEIVVEAETFADEMDDAIEVLAWMPMPDAYKPPEKE